MKNNQAKICNNTLSSPMENGKQNTQQHVTFTSGTRKTVTQQTHCPHRWYTQNSHATTCCPHQSYTPKQSYNNTWYTQIVTQLYVALTSGLATTACCLHRWYLLKQCQRTGRLHQQNTIESFSTNDKSDYEHKIWKKVVKSMRNVSNLVRGTRRTTSLK